MGLAEIRSGMKPTVADMAYLSGRQWDHPMLYGCVGLWLMNESGGATVFDASGYGYNASSSALRTISDTGLAVGFDNTNINVDLGAATRYFNFTDYTIMVRCNPTAWQDLDGIISASTSPPYPYSLRHESSALRCLVNGTSYTFGSALATGVYHTVASVFVSTTVLHLYKNGALVASPTPGVKPTPGSEALRVGLDYTSRYFDGVVDYVGIFNRALAASEVADWHHTPYLWAWDSWPRYTYYSIPAAAGGFQAAWARQTINSNLTPGGVL